jgi:hypothetical protein
MAPGKGLSTMSSRFQLLATAPSHDDSVLHWTSMSEPMIPACCKISRQALLCVNSHNNSYRRSTLLQIPRAQ